VTRPRATRRWVGGLTSAVALAAVVWWAAHQARPRFPTGPGALLDLAATMALYAVATVLRGWRWHRILGGLGASHRTSDAYALVAVGYFGNTVLPARGGELLRTVLLAERSDARKREVLGSIISERMLDAVSLAMLFAVLTWARVAGAPMGQRPALVAVAALVGGAATVWGYLRARRGGRLVAFAARVQPLVRASRPLIGPMGLALSALTVLIWGIEGTIFWLVTRSLALEVNLLDGYFLVVRSAFFALIPAAPGYVGTFDGAVLFGLKALGVGGGQAVGFAILVRFVLFVPVTLTGLLLLLTRYRGVRPIKPRTAAAVPSRPSHMPSPRPSE
jgi:glycosyltransferase 2 family protein